MLLRVTHAGLCATQIEEVFTSSRNHKYMPHLFGHEGLGIVEAIGSGVETKRVGDVCILHWRPSSKGLDAEPGRYYSAGRMLNAGKCVAFGEYVVVPENRLSIKPSEMTSVSAVLTGCSVSTGWGSFFKSELATMAESVAVIGLGNVGLSAAIGGTLRQKSVWVIEPRVSLAPAIKELKVVKAFRSMGDLEDALIGFDSETFPSLVIDTSGSADAIEVAQKLLPRNGLLVLVGMPKHRYPQLNVQKMLDGMKVVGSNGGGVDHAIDLDKMWPTAEIFTRLQSGSLVQRVGFDELSLAIGKSLDGVPGKFVLVDGDS